MKRMCMILISFSFVFLLLGCENGNGETNVNSIDNNQVPDNSIEILIRNGHPRFYDSIESAQLFWKDHLNVVDLEDYKTYKHYDSIIFWADDLLDYLDNINIYFDKTYEGKVTLEKALDIAKDYLPLYIKEYYEFNESCIICGDGGANEFSDTIHKVSYKITAEGYEKRENTKIRKKYSHDIYTMPYMINVYCYGKESIGTLRITTDELRVEWHLRTQHAKIEKWDFDYFNMENQEQ